MFWTVQGQTKQLIKGLLNTLFLSHSPFYPALPTFSFGAIRVVLEYYCLPIAQGTLWRQGSYQISCILRTCSKPLRHLTTRDTFKCPHPWFIFSSFPLPLFSLHISILFSSSYLQPVSFYFFLFLYPPSFASPLGLSFLDSFLSSLPTSSTLQHMKRASFMSALLLLP